MPVSLFKIKQGDRRPYLKGQLVTFNDDGEVEGPQPLTGATVVFSMRNPETGEVLIEEAAAEILDSDEGQVQYKWQEGDTDIEPGDYEGEFEATFGEEPVTFPNGKIGFRIRVTRQIA